MHSRGDISVKNEIAFYKAEYENLRRKKNAQIERMKMQQCVFAKKTIELLTHLGLSMDEIVMYYKEEKNV